MLLFPSNPFSLREQNVKNGYLSLSTCKLYGNKTLNSVFFGYDFQRMTYNILRAIKNLTFRTNRAISMLFQKGTHSFLATLLTMGYCRLCNSSSNMISLYFCYDQRLQSGNSRHFLVIFQYYLFFGGGRLCKKRYMYFTGNQAQYYNWLTYLE